MDDTKTRVVIPVDAQRVREIVREMMAAPVVTHPRGCVCPPGSERTCRGVMCPRAAMKVL